MLLYISFVRVRQDILESKTLEVLVQEVDPVLVPEVTPHVGAQNIHVLLEDLHDMTQKAVAEVQTKIALVDTEVHQTNWTNGIIHTSLIGECVGMHLLLIV